MINAATSVSLRPRLLSAFSGSEAPEERASALRGRPIVVFGPQSLVGCMQLPALVAAGANIVLAIDDRYDGTLLHGCIPVCSSTAFLAGVARVRNAVFVDFSLQPYSRAIAHQLAEVSGLKQHDLLELLAAYDCHAIYETVRTMRQRTLARADGWLALADRLADDFSRETLYALLLQRLEYAREVVHAINIGGRDEYFGTGAQSDTFSLGRREHFVDCGAHRGTIVQKLLGATGGHYASVHAFEPDVENRAGLQWLTPSALPNMRVHPYAVSDRREVLRFAQTGTMGSHVASDGNIEVQAVALDEIVEQASFIKMDVEGFEPRALRGAKQLLARHRPRLAIASYHYAHDLLDVAQVLDDSAPGYRLRVRQHYDYYCDAMLYASMRHDGLPDEVFR